MRKVLVLFSVLLLSLTMAFSTNIQKIHAIDSPLFEAINLLYIANGYALPSTSGPWSSDELLKMLEKIDRTKQTSSAQAIYDYVFENLDQGKRTFQFRLDSALEGYLHTDTTNFTKEEQWIRGYNGRKPFLDIVLETWPSNHFYGYSSFPIMGTEFTGFSTTEGVVSSFFGQQAITTNLFFLPPGTVEDLDLGVPYRAFGALGGDGWSVQVGRDKLSWGPGVTGNFMVGEHLKYHNAGRLTTYGDKFKYTFLTSFFPHPINYTPVMISEEGFNNPGSQAQLLLGLNMFMAHRLEWRMFKDKVGFSLSESIMYRSLDGALDLRILSPAMMFHNYYIRSNANSLLTLELDYSPIKYLNLYGQLAVDEIAFGIEPVVGKDDGAYPPASGYMLGAKGAYPYGKGIFYGSLEGAYTDPFLYLRYDKSPGSSESETYGLDYVVAIREFYKAGEILYHQDFLGYQYGPDAIVTNLNVGYKEFGAWYVEGNIFYMLHGTHDKWTQWKIFNKNDTYYETPTNGHVSGNLGDNIAKTNRNAVSRTLVLGVKGGYTILPALDVYGQIDYVQIINPGNISSNAPIRDMQLTLGISYSFT